jgi:hypothetical protein
MPNGIYPVPKFRFDEGRRHSVWLKLKVLARRDRLDEQLALGIDPARSATLWLRAEQLIRRRAGLADRIEDVLESAGRPAPFTAAVPVRRTEVRACAEDLLALARRLRDGQPVDVHGIALTSRLLSDGSSPLYATGDGSLRHAVRAARLALDPVGAVGTGWAAAA